MGAGILPTTIHKNKLYFLFGKENKFADTPGFSDFGGGTDNNESYLQTAIREGGEELTGFLGSDKDLARMLKKRGTYNINNAGDYRMHIFYYKYDEALPHYYNNNQRFIQSHLDEHIIKKTKIFEKAEIEWFCIDDLMRRRSEFRSYFQKIVDKIVAQHSKIFKFIQKRQSSDSYVSLDEDSKSSYDWDDVTSSASSSASSSTTATVTATSSSTSSPKTQKAFNNKKRRNKKTRSHKKIHIF